MKYAFVVAAVAVLSCGANAMADDGNVTKSQLSDLGLPGLNVMSDAQGSEIRGQGFAFAASVSASALPGSFTLNPAVALANNPGSNVAVAATGAQSDFQAGGFFGGIGPGGGFLGFFGVGVSVGSSGYAFAASN